MSERDPILIVGLGIAGSCLWHCLNKAGVEVEVVEPGDPRGASQVAPGVVNPLAGKRLKPSWRVEEQLPKALETYEAFAQLLGQRFFHPKPILRIIKDERQRQSFDERRVDKRAAAFIGREHPPHAFGNELDDPYGSFLADGSGHLDAHELTQKLREYLKHQERLHETTLAYEDLSPSADGVTWQGRPYARVIFCEGWKAARNPWFQAIPYNPAKGEMLTLRIPNLNLPDAIINRGKWLLPLGGDLYKAGATYAWDAFEAGPSETAREEILTVLREYIQLPEVEVIDQTVGVRPIINDYRPVLGLNPEQLRLGIFNGLGSKGVLAAPWLAERMTGFLLEGESLPPEVDVQRFFKPQKKRRSH